MMAVLSRDLALHCTTALNGLAICAPTPRCSFQHLYPYKATAHIQGIPRIAVVRRGATQSVKPTPPLRAPLESGNVLRKSRGVICST
jgi:hypothetical protein